MQIKVIVVVVVGSKQTAYNNKTVSWKSENYAINGLNTKVIYKSSVSGRNESLLIENDQCQDSL